MFSISSAPYFLLYVMISFVCIIITLLLWKSEISWKESAAQGVMGLVIALAATASGKYYMLSDVEILNGQVVSKHRDHDHYVETYETCSTDSKGNRSCTTHYEDHYTVDVYFKTTIGKIVLMSLDSTWRSVYDTPSPKEYTEASKGTPVSRESSYINYVKNASHSLIGGNVSEEIKATVNTPPYPRVHNHYKVNRVLTSNVTIHPSIKKEVTDIFNERLKTIGPRSKANAFVLFTNYPDSQYRYFLESAWSGGKKNDVIIVVGTDAGGTGKSKYPRIGWVEIMTFAGNRGNTLLAEQLGRTIKEYEYFTPEVANLSLDMISQKFDLPKMEDYEYLKDEIDPPTWLVIVLSFAQLILGLLLGAFFSQNDALH